MPPNTIPQISHLDHLVLTVADLDTTIQWYTTVLGMRAITFGEGRWALHFGEQKINLHQRGQEFEPKAAQPAPGSADLCFITLTNIADMVVHLTRCGVAIEEGPVARTGATRPIESVYVRDPDQNLIEIAHVVA